MFFFHNKFYIVLLLLVLVVWIVLFTNGLLFSWMLCSFLLRAYLPLELLVSVKTICSLGCESIFQNALKKTLLKCNRYAVYLYVFICLHVCIESILLYVFYICVHSWDNHAVKIMNMSTILRSFSVLLCNLCNPCFFLLFIGNH